MKRVLILLGICAVSGFVAVNGFAWSFNISGFSGTGGQGTPELALANTLMMLGALGVVLSLGVLSFLGVRGLVRFLMREEK